MGLMSGLKREVKRREKMAGLRFSSTHLCLLGNRFVLFLVLLNLLYQRRTDT